MPLIHTLWQSTILQLWFLAYGTESIKHNFSFISMSHSINYAANSKCISIKECVCHCSLVYSIGYFCLGYVEIFVLIGYSSLLSLPMLNGILLLEEKEWNYCNSWVRRNLSRILLMLYFLLLFDLGPENTWKIRIMLNCHYSQTIINKVP